jgi:hypothetical protein
MEDFESPSLESGSWLSTGWEKTREQSEKQRESYKKAQAQIQRSQKDEKKAQWDNEQLFHILERFIQNPYYEELIPVVTHLLSRSVPSRFILSMIALFYPEAAIHLLNTIWKHKDIDILLSIHRESEMRDFDESTLHPSIRAWMSTWVQSSQAYMTQWDMSIVLQDKLVFILSEDSSVLDSLAQGLLFFFRSRNLYAEKHKMIRYAEHIIHEYMTAMKKSMNHSEDKDLIEAWTIGDHIFFGLSDHPSSRS